MTQMNLSVKQKQTHRHREQTVVAKGAGGRGTDGVGVWDQQMQTIMYIYKTEALCCTPETNTTL